VIAWTLAADIAIAPAKSSTSEAASKLQLEKEFLTLLTCGKDAAGLIFGGWQCW
jgi:hypothetical protein